MNWNVVDPERKILPPKTLCTALFSSL
ncbi:hypothetical protein TorRG33x02_235880 [Trema orientale]|uniref:Uncharacterized protein n=1 Tax=Trema orientale TaxID=63057 RepID=A0A2P5E1A8_TREOI|nr:hypothetical protein TorRG33x02_235880 [Trema orientale]